MAAQNPKPASKPTDIGLEMKTPTDGVLETKTPKEGETPQHKMNKAAVIVGVVGVVALIFIAVR